MVYFSVGKHNKVTNDTFDKVEECYIIAMLEQYPKEMKHWLRTINKAINQAKILKIIK